MNRLNRSLDNLLTTIEELQRERDHLAAALNHIIRGVMTMEKCDVLTVLLMQWGVKEDWRMNLDRFSQGLPDPQNAEVMAYCAGCCAEIYPGEDVYRVNGDILHADWECLYRYIDPEFTTVEEALGVE